MEELMSGNSIFSPSGNPESLLNELDSSEGLPFQTLLSKKDIYDCIKNLKFRERIFTPVVTVWAFLSQVLSSDQSLQATLTRVIAFF